ncbi:MAG: FHA domain-containing protein [Candidatus Hydrogenedentota bacterium]|nr:MAG: FHA domain-containing protein [Candidatus Hydrogenedentota bacterium]
MASLKILIPTELQGEIQIDQRVVTLGRSPENDIRIDAPTIAPVHASIIDEGKRYLLIDHSSRYGTFVDGVQVDRKVLQPGNRIGLGRHAELLFFVPTESEQLTDGKVLIAAEQAGGPISDIQKKLTLEEAGFDYEAGLSGKPFETEMQKRYLSTIYQVNQSITQIFDPTELTHKVVDLILQIFPVDRAGVILYDPETQEPYPLAFKVRNEPNGSGPINISQTIVRKAIFEKNAIMARDTHFDERLRNVSSIIRKRIRSVMCVPLHTKGKILGALYADSLKVPRRFTEGDLRLLFAVGGALANSIENASLVTRIKEEERKLGTLERYLPSAVVEHLFHREQPTELGGKYAPISALFADIRGFTRLAEKMSPGDLVFRLNEYFTSMSEIVLEYGGTLGEYIGDEIMAYFGAPLKCEDHAMRAISVALSMMDRMRSLRTQWEKVGSPVFDIGIGVATGTVIAGNVGSTRQMKYTVIGNTVNVARRLCAHAGPGQILICSETYQSAGEPSSVRFLETASLKGISKAVDVYEVRQQTE